MEKLFLALQPEFGHPTSLWADNVPFPRRKIRVVTFPDELGLSSELSEKVLQWTRYWAKNYINHEDLPNGRPMWKNGSDVEAWVSQGNDIELSLISELPDYQVHSRWCSYAKNVRFIDSD